MDAAVVWLKEDPARWVAAGGALDVILEARRIKM
jgi:hypothetical protein